MKLPGPPRLHVWLGIILAFAGALVGGYAYTGERIYEIVYLPVALFGLLLLVAGSALAGYGQANRPRLGGARSDEDDVSTLDRLRRWLAGLTGSSDDPEGIEAEETQASADATGEEASAQTERGGEQDTDEAGEDRDGETGAIEGERTDEPGTPA